MSTSVFRKLFNRDAHATHELPNRYIKRGKKINPKSVRTNHLKLELSVG